MERFRPGVLLLVLLLLPLVAVAAEGDGAGLRLSALPSGTVDVDVDPVLSVTVDGHGIVSDDVLRADIEDAEGSVVWTQSSPFTVQPGGSLDLELNLSTVPTGQHLLLLSLENSSMVSNATHATTASVMIERARPLAVSVEASTADRVEALDENGSPNGEDPRHGDRVAWFLSVSNEGDVDWEGAMAVKLEQHEVNETQSLNVVVLAMGSTQLVILSNATWAEGPLSLEATLEDVNDEVPENDGVTINVTVAPPPLPSLRLTLERATEPERAGESIAWTLNATNEGEADFDGTFACTWSDGQPEREAAPLVLAVGASSSTAFSGTARDGTLVCTLEGARLAEGSDLNASDTLSLPTARFELVAGAEPLPLGGPWDVGDMAEWSAVARNVGEQEGHVRLVLSSAEGSHETEALMLEPGEARELRVVHELLSPGNTVWTWSLASTDGSILTPSGEAVVEVHEAASLHVNIEALVMEEDGFVVAWNASVTSSRARTAVLEVGHGTLGAWVWSTSTTLDLDEGWLGGETPLGWASSERVAVRLTAVGWAHANGPVLVSEPLSATNAALAVEVQRGLQPADPSPGTTTSVSVMVSNQGTRASDAGVLHLVAGGGLLLQRADVPALEAGESQVLTMQVVWPEGSPVDLSALLWHDGTLVTGSLSVDLPTTEPEAALTIPWSSLALGAVAGAAIVMVEAIRRRAPRTSPEQSNKAKPPAVGKEDAASKIVEKVEVGCPSCERTLRVPGDYTGAVRCPDCKERFEVEAQSDHAEAPPKEDDVEVVEAPEKVEISCPSCTQTLRIPAGFGGRVRCPACREEFSSEEGA